MIRRRSLTTADRVRIFGAHDGICEFCDGKITVGQAWEISHTIPLEMGGADDDTNMRPAHKKCHREHTAKVDQPAIAKTKRQHAKHIGAMRKRSWSKLRRKMNGEVVPRDE